MADSTLDELVAGLLVTPADKGKPPAADDKKDDAAAVAQGDQTTSDANDAAQDDADKADAAPANQSTDDGDADGGDDQDGDTQDADTEPSYTVKVDGKETTVKLSEALAGYQRFADYTRKTQEVAEHRKAVDTELEQTRAARGQYEQILGELQRRLGPADGERTEEQWNQLRAQDPAKYAQEYTDFVRRQQQRQTIAREQERINQQKQAEALTKLRTYVDGERVKLHAALPEFGDPQKGPVALKAMRDFARETLGFSEQELDQAYDSRILIMADMARKWSEHVKTQQAAKAKLDKAPSAINQTPAPKGPPPNAKSRKAKADADAMKRLEKTGKIEDALSLILS